VSLFGVATTGVATTPAAHHPGWRPGQVPRRHGDHGEVSRRRAHPTGGPQDWGWRQGLPGAAHRPQRRSRRAACVQVRLTRRPSVSGRQVAAPTAWQSPRTTPRCQALGRRDAVPSLADLMGSLASGRRCCLTGGTSTGRITGSWRPCRDRWAVRSFEVSTVGLLAFSRAFQCHRFVARPLREPIGADVHEQVDAMRTVP